MKKNKLLWVTTIVCILPMILSAILYDRLPEQVAIHFDSAGIADNYAPKAFAAFGLPILMAALNAFTHFIMNNDPKKMNSALALKYMGKWIIPIMTVVLVPFTLFNALGYKIPLLNVMPIFVGVIILAFGNYLPKCKQNYTIGIKLPWTLNSEVNWNKTHHLAGYVWMLGGVCMIIGSCIRLQSLPLILSITLLITIVPFLYSYHLYRKGV